MSNEKKKGGYLIFLLTGLLALFIYLFNDGSDYIKLSYILTFYLAVKLIQDLGRKVPFVNLVMFITVVQYLLAPALDYEYLRPYNPYFYMKLPQDLYYPYAFYAVLALWAGFAIPLYRANKDIDFIRALKNSPVVNGKIGIALIAVGLVSNYLSLIFHFPNALNFIITLLGLMRFVGLLFIWLSNHKYKKMIMGAVMIEFTLYTLASAIIIQLVILAIFFYSYYTLVNKPNKIKIISVGVVALVALFLIQSVKTDYRRQVWFKGITDDRFQLFSTLLSDKVNNMTTESFLTTAASVNLRINQGWVMQMIMRNLPARRPFLNGTVFEEEAMGLILPRFILTDKATVQSSEKFEKFVGYKLRGYTIAVGILGDGYGNFGPEGGMLFCFLVGLFFNFCLFIFYKVSEQNPSVYLWGILVFFYLIRAGDDFYIISNWIIKSSMLLVAVYFLFKRSLVMGYKKFSLRRRHLVIQ